MVAIAKAGSASTTHTEAISAATKPFFINIPDLLIVPILLTRLGNANPCKKIEKFCRADYRTQDNVTTRQQIRMFSVVNFRFLNNKRSFYFHRSNDGADTSVPNKQMSNIANIKH